ncbi:hypothetical protein [Thermaurantiacus sp.]
MDDRELDEALSRWAQAPATDEAALARLEAHGEALARPVRRWWPAAAAAAAAAVALLLLLPRPATAPPAPPAAPRVAGSDPALSFALLYTPTLDEELVL